MAKKKPEDRVKNKLPIPTICPNCGGAVEKRSNASIYGKEYGYWPYVYKCDDCDSYVGLHPNTDIPLGTLADKPTREWRKQAKKMFLEYLELNNISRSEGYKQLATSMGIPLDTCHFGWFTVDQCRQAKDAILYWVRGDL